MTYPNENFKNAYEELQSLAACLEQPEIEALVIIVRKMLDVEAEGDFDYLTPKDIKLLDEAHEHRDDVNYWNGQNVADNLQEKSA